MKEVNDVIRLVKDRRAFFVSQPILSLVFLFIYNMRCNKYVSIQLQENSHSLFNKFKPLTKCTHLREERHHNETSHIVLRKTNYFINSDLGKTYNSSMWHKGNKVHINYTPCNLIWV